MKVWALFDDGDGYSSEHLLGVFSSRQAAIDWLRKSRRFMWGETGGPIVPEGSRLNERFWVREETVDPEPLRQGEGDGGAIA